MYRLIDDKNRTTIYLLPLLKLGKNLITKVKSAYIDSYIDPVIEYGDYLFVLYNKDLLTTGDGDIISKHPRFTQSYVTVDGFLVKYYLTEEEKETIVQPMLLGEYSKINREYAQSFKEYRFENKIIKKNPVRCVLFKDKILKKELEDTIGMTLPKGAELDSVPILEWEIHSYDKTTFKTNRSTYRDYRETSEHSSELSNKPDMGDSEPPSNKESTENFGQY